LLSDAGMGKTTELHRVYDFLLEKELAFTPHLIPLNTYTNQSICELLQENWDRIPQKTPVVILDGLDEIDLLKFDSSNLYNADGSNNLYNVNISQLPFVFAIAFSGSLNR